MNTISRNSVVQRCGIYGMLLLLTWWYAIDEDVHREGLTSI